MPDTYTMIDPREPDYCAGCILKNKFKDHGGITHVAFEQVGDAAPEVLFVAESPGQEEKRLGRPLIGRSGQILRKSLKQLTDNYLLANVVQCHPTEGANRTPETDEITYCSRYVKQLVQQQHIDKVVILGRSATTGLIDEAELHGKSIAQLMNSAVKVIKGISYSILYHPAYFLHKGPQWESDPEYDVWVNKLDDTIRNKVLDHVELPVPVHMCTIDNLCEVIYEYKDEPEIGYDIEASGGFDPWYINFIVLGFSISTRAQATYIEMTRAMTPAEIKLLVWFLKSRSVWTYNCKFEMKAAWRFLGEYIKMQDAFTLCKIAGYMRTLKLNAILLLSAGYWADHKDKIVGLFEECLLQAKKVDTAKDTMLLYSGQFAELDQQKYAPLLKQLDDLSRYLSTEEIIRGLQCDSPWAACPPRIMGRYCCGDSYYTLRLKDRLWEEHKQVYSLFLSQSWLAGVMESYGLCFNDAVASKLESYYTEEGIKCLAELIQAMSFTKLVEEQSVDCTDETRLDAINIHGDISLTIDKKLERLKEIFNPMTSKYEHQAPFWANYRTEYTRGAAILYSMHTHITSDYMIPDELTKCLDRHSVNNSVNNLMAIDYSNYAQNAKTIKEKIMTAITHAFQEVDSHFQGFNMGMFEFQYKASKAFGGVDPDKEATWSHEFRMLYLLRRFRKVMKSRSTYIKGRVGRKAVWLSTMQDWRAPPIRLKNYTELPKGYQLKQNEVLIFNSDFLENMAETHRWRAAVHTIPWECELRELYVPRSPEALTCHSDYSQNELRAIAAMSGDETMLQRFKEKVDVHRFVASKVWKIPEAEVTPAQRRYAKIVIFSLLYGKTPANLAAEYMNNDLDAANQLFADVYTAFPRVKMFIDDCHRQARESGKVRTLFGNYINVLDNGKLDNKAMRNAQNFPIQSTSSHLAGYAGYLVYDRCRSLGIDAIPLAFGHDSLDFEVAVKDLDRFNKVLQAIAIDFIRAKFGVPVDIETEYGLSQQYMMEIHEKDKTSNTIRYKFKCPEKSLYQIIDKLSEFYDVDHQVTSKEEKYQSMEEMFMLRRAFSMYFGQTISYTQGEMTLAPVGSA